MKNLFIIILLFLSFVLVNAQEKTIKNSILSDHWMLCTDSIDSLIIAHIPNNIFFARNMTKEAFLENVKQTITICSKKDVNNILNLLLLCKIEKQMNYSANQCVKNVRVFDRRGHLNFAWFDEEKSDFRSLIIFCHKRKYELVWIDPWRWVFIDNYCCEITNEINDYISNLFEEE